MQRRKRKQVELSGEIDDRMPQMRFDSRNVLLLHPQIASRQHATECPVIEHPVGHLRPAPRDPEFLRARRARMEHDKIVAQPVFATTSVGPGFGARRQVEPNFARAIVHSERREQSEVMIDCVDEPDLRGQRTRYNSAAGAVRDGWCRM